MHLELMATVKPVISINLAVSRRNICARAFVCANVSQGSAEVSAPKLRQRQILSGLIVCLHNKSNVSGEIIYMRTVLNK